MNVEEEAKAKNPIGIVDRQEVGVLNVPVGIMNHQEDLEIQEASVNAPDEDHRPQPKNCPWRREINVLYFVCN